MSDPVCARPRARRWPLPATEDKIGGKGGWAELAAPPEGVSRRRAPGSPSSARSAWRHSVGCSSRRRHHADREGAVDGRAPPHASRAASPVGAPLTAASPLSLAHESQVLKNSAYYSRYQVRLGAKGAREARAARWFAAARTGRLPRPGGGGERGVGGARGRRPAAGPERRPAAPGRPASRPDDRLRVRRGAGTTVRRWTRAPGQQGARRGRRSPGSSSGIAAAAGPSRAARARAAAHPPRFLDAKGLAAGSVANARSRAARAGWAPRRPPPSRARAAWRMWWRWARGGEGRGVLGGRRWRATTAGAGGSR